MKPIGFKRMAYVLFLLAAVGAMPLSSAQADPQGSPQGPKDASISRHPAVKVFYRDVAAFPASMAATRKLNLSFVDSRSFDQAGNVPSQSGVDPVWTISARCIYMQLSTPTSQVLIIFPSGKPNLSAANLADFARNPDFSGGSILSDASQLHFEFQPGAEFALVRRISDDWKLEARSVQIEGLAKRQGLNVTAPPVNLNDMGPNIGGYGTNPRTIFYAAPGTAFDLFYKSGMLSVECMLWRRLNDSLRIGGGFRWIEFYDDISIYGFFGGSELERRFPPVASTLEFDAKNDLYGLQIAGEGRLWPRQRLNIEAIVRAGIYGNAARQSSLFDQQIVHIRGAASASGSALAFGGDLNVVANLKLSNRFSLQGGYNLMWLQGLALGSHQVSNTSALNTSAGESTMTGQTRLDTGGGIFAHGPTFGLKFLW